MNFARLFIHAQRSTILSSVPTTQASCFFGHHEACASDSLQIWLLQLNAFRPPAIVNSHTVTASPERCSLSLLCDHVSTELMELHWLIACYPYPVKIGSLMRITFSFMHHRRRDPVQSGFISASTYRRIDRHHRLCCAAKDDDPVVSNQFWNYEDVLFCFHSCTFYWWNWKLCPCL